MTAPSVVHSYKASATLGGATLTLNLTLTAPASGNAMAVFVTCPAALAIAPSLTGVASWSELSSIATDNSINTSSVWTGLVGSGAGTTLSLAFSGGSAGLSVIVQAVEITAQGLTLLDGSVLTQQQAAQTTTSFSGTTASLSTTLATDLVLAYMSLAVGAENPGIGVGPTGGFTSVSTEGITGGSNGELVAQLAYLQTSTVGTYSSSQGWTQALSGFSNYCQSLILAIAPVLPTEAQALASPTFRLPGIGLRSL